MPFWFILSIMENNSHHLHVLKILKYHNTKQQTNSNSKKIKINQNSEKCTRKGNEKMSSRFGATPTPRWVEGRWISTALAIWHKRIYGDISEVIKIGEVR